MKRIEDLTPEEWREQYPQVCELTDAVNKTKNPQHTLKLLKAILAIYAQEKQSHTENG